LGGPFDGRFISTVGGQMEGFKVVQWVGEKRKAKYVIRKKMNCFAVIQLKK